jgi:hypothetical protein
MEGLLNLVLRIVCQFMAKYRSVLGDVVKLSRQSNPD